MEPENEQIVWNHESNDYPIAMGMTKERLEQIMRKYNRLVRHEDKLYPDCRSGFAQLLYDNFTKIEVIIVMQALKDQDRITRRDTLRKLFEHD
jgi:hypothetical protein